MSWGGSPSCGFDLNESSWSFKKKTRRKRLLIWFKHYFYYKEKYFWHRVKDIYVPNMLYRIAEFRYMLKKKDKHRCSYCKYFYLSAIRDSYGDCLKKDGQIRGSVNRNEKGRKCFVKEPDKKKTKGLNTLWLYRLWPPEGYDEFWKE